MDKKSAVGILVEACAGICDNICKFRDQCNNEDELFEHCENCPMNLILE